MSKHQRVIPGEAKPTEGNPSLRHLISPETKPRCCNQTETRPLEKNSLTLS
jgi:hypothetical protein